MPETAQTTETVALRHDLLPLDAIEEDPRQPRQSFSDASLEELAANIEDTADGSETPWVDGLLHPVVVYPNPAHGEEAAAPPYRLYAGARRLRAYRLRGWPAIPAQIRESPSSAARAILTQLNENAGREDVSLYETALAVHRAFELWKQENPGGRSKDFAAAFGRSAPWVSQQLAVARSRGLAKEALEEGLIRHGEAARLFKKLPAAAQKELLAQARRSRSPITARAVKERLQPPARSRPGSSAAAGKAGGATAGAGRQPEGQAQGSTPEKTPAGVVVLRIGPDQARRLLEVLGAPVPERDPELAPALYRALEQAAPPAPTDSGAGG